MRFGQTGFLVAVCAFVAACQGDPGGLSRDEKALEASVDDAKDVLGNRCETLVRNGLIRGVVEGETVAYRGIPYARPPTGELRWRAPQPAADWDGVRDAAKFGSPCPQPPLKGLESLGAEMSEDCLTLNVYTPADRGTKGDRPVLVYVHGGGLRNNAMENPGFDGHTFVEEQGIVVVTFNYRLGRHGFFAHPDLGSPSGEAAGNYGFLDQLAALEWVQANIGAFGGDPDRVTIMGISAGSVSVINLAALPEATDLFDGVIAMSGPASQYRYPDVAQNGFPSLKQEAEAYVEFFGLGEGVEAVASLRDVPWQAFYTPDVLELQAGMGMTVAAVDGDLVTSPAEQVFAAGAQAKVPMMLGTTSFEANIARRNAPEVLELETIRDGFGPYFERLRTLYGDLGDKAFGEALWSDFVMLLGMRRTAELHAPHAPTYVYRMDYVPERVRSMFPGLPHGLDGHLLFDAGRSGPSKSSVPWTAKDKDRARALRARWGAFVRTGDPNVDGMVTWPQFEAGTEASMLLGNVDTIETNFRTQNLEYLEELFDAFCEGTADVRYFATARLRPSCPPTVRGSAQAIE